MLLMWFEDLVKTSSLPFVLQLGKVYGIESHVLSPAETKDLYPLMNVDDLYGTLYVPKDGTMDPAGTCTTLTRAASARGATVIFTAPLTAYFDREYTVYLQLKTKT